MGTRNSGIGFDWTAVGRCCATANGLFGRPAQFAHSSNWTLMRMPCLKLTIVRGCCIDQQAVASINFNRRHHPPPCLQQLNGWRGDAACHKGDYRFVLLLLLHPRCRRGWHYSFGISSRINLLPLLRYTNTRFCGISFVKHAKWNWQAKSNHSIGKWILSGIPIWCTSGAIASRMMIYQ